MSHARGRRGVIIEPRRSPFPLEGIIGEHISVVKHAMACGSSIRATRTVLEAHMSEPRRGCRGMEIALGVLGSSRHEYGSQPALGASADLSS